MFFSHDNFTIYGLELTFHKIKEWRYLKILQVCQGIQIVLGLQPLPQTTLIQKFTVSHNPHLNVLLDKVPLAQIFLKKKWLSDKQCTIKQLQELSELMEQCYKVYQENN
jgi:hypothetical protein